MVREHMNFFCEHSEKIEEQSLDFDKVMVSWFTFVLMSLMNNIGTSLAKKKKMVHEPMNLFCEHRPKIEEQSQKYRIELTYHSEEYLVLLVARHMKRP